MQSREQIVAQVKQNFSRIANELSGESIDRNSLTSGYPVPVEMIVHLVEKQEGLEAGTESLSEHIWAVNLGDWTFPGATYDHAARQLISSPSDLRIRSVESRPLFNGLRPNEDLSPSKPLGFWDRMDAKFISACKGAWILTGAVLKYVSGWGEIDEMVREIEEEMIEEENGAAQASSDEGVVG